MDSHLVLSMHRFWRTHVATGHDNRLLALFSPHPNSRLLVVSHRLSRQHSFIQRLLLCLTDIRGV